MKKFCLFIALLLPALTACQSQQPATPLPAPAPQETRPVVQREETDGIAMQVEVNKSRFETRDEIRVQVRIENVGQEPIPYHGSSGCDPGFNVLIPLPELDQVMQRKVEGEPQACTSAFVGYTLEPGEVLTAEEVFLPRFRSQWEGEIDVPSGPYHVRATFNRGSYMDNEADERMELLVPIEVSSDTELRVSKEQARTLADRHPEVKSWLADHSGAHLVKNIDGQQPQVLFGDEWHPATQEEIDAVMTLPHPENVSIRYADGIWRLHYAIKYGSEPHALSVDVDAVSGEVKAVRRIKR